MENSVMPGTMLSPIEGYCTSKYDNAGDAMLLRLGPVFVLVGESTSITPASMVQAAIDQKPQLAREYVDIFNPSVVKLRGLVDWDQMKDIPRLAHRFNSSNCELMRFGAQSSLHLVRLCRPSAQTIIASGRTPSMYFLFCFALFH